MQALSFDRLSEALHHIPADLPRDEWVRVAMALKSGVGEHGFGLFDNWSQSGRSYSAGDVKSTWRSVKPEGGIGLGTLARMAKCHGFRGSLRVLRQPGGQRGKAASVPAHTASVDPETDAGHEAAKARAVAIWNNARERIDCAYLARKGVKAYGVRVDRAGRLIVPLRDAAGVLWSVQRIEAVTRAGRPDKLLTRGGRKSGLWHWCGAPDSAQVLLIAEGYATAATLHEATGWPAAVAFDAGNLAAVAASLRGAYPDTTIVLCADDDRGTAQRTGTNVGRAKATEAAAAVGALVALPIGLPDDGTDFNDLAAHAGLAAVRQCVAEVVERAHEAGRPADGVDCQRNVTEAPPVTGEAPVTGPDPFTLDESGVWYLDRDREGRPRGTIWVCSPLAVTAQTRDTEAGVWGLLLEFRDPRGVPVHWAMPNRMLAGDGTDFRATLLDRGLRIATGMRERGLLARYVHSRQPDRMVRCTERLGWHGPSYVFPNETLGLEDESIMYQAEGRNISAIGQRGALADWQQGIARVCVGNSRLAFAVSCAFAGPMLRLANVDSGGFHFRGESSSGKTTALRVAASVYGGPGVVQRWRATDNALEVIAAQHCDQLLILDELGQVEPRTAGEIAYMLANEQSKARSTRTGQARPRLSWRLLFLSAGEIGLAGHMAEGGKRARAGQETRLADIPADAGAGRGIFEDLHGFANGAEMARYLAKVCDVTYGSSGRAWIEWLVQHRDALRDRVRRLAAQILAGWLPSDAGGQTHRVGERFAIVAAAGELATEAALTGWASGVATGAVKACFEAWLDERGGSGNVESWRMVQQVREFIERNGESRFTDWDRATDESAPPVRDRAGFKRRLKDPTSDEVIGVEYYLFLNVFREEVARGHDYKAVLKALRDLGYLMPSSGRPFDFSVRLPGIGRANCYRIGSTILADGESDLT